jgi:hypothetical protein
MTLDGLEILDISDPTHPQRVGGNKNIGQLSVYNSGVVATENEILVAAGYHGLSILSKFQMPTLRVLDRAAGPGIEFTVQGTAGMTVQLQRSPDLRDWSNWGTAIILLLEPTRMTDSQGTGTGSTFYRAVVR